MPDNKKITLVRRDGSYLTATREEAEKLKLLGYREETPVEAHERDARRGEEAFYTQPLEQVKAGAEAFGRGLSVGLTDYAFGDEDTAKRAEHNAGGINTALEITGALAPILLSGGTGAVAQIASKTPTALASRGAIAGAEAVGLTGGKAVIAGGALEGAGIGAASTFNHAWLSGDPLTGEAVLHGVGWGAVFGAGLSAAGVGISKAASKAQGAITKAEDAIGAVEDKVDDISLARQKVDDLKTQATTAKMVEHERFVADHEKWMADAIKFQPGQFASVVDEPFKGFKAEADRLAAEIKSATDAADAVLSGQSRKLLLSASENIPAGELAALYKKQRAALHEYNKAIKSENFSMAKAEEAGKAYQEKVASLAERLGLAAEQSNVSTAIKEYAQMKVIQRELSKMPATAEQFARMTDAKAERLFATLESAKKLSSFPVMAKAVDDAASQMAEAIGIQGGGVEGLRAVWKSSREQLRKETQTTREMTRRMAEFERKQAEFAKWQHQEKVKAATAEYRAKVRASKGKPDPDAPEVKPGLLARGAGHLAGSFVAAKNTFGGLGAMSAAYSTTRNFVTGVLSGKGAAELGAARTNSIGRLTRAVAKYGEKAGRGVQKIGPRIEPLAVKIDGSFDLDNKSKEELAALRIREFAEATPHIKNTLYLALEPLSVAQPELVPAMHKAAVSVFEAFRSLLPADPGVVSGLKPIWKPSPLQATIMSKQYEVFHDPVGVAENMLASGDFDPVKIKALRVLAPNVYQHLRTELIMKITEPGFLDSFNYNEQIGLGTMLDIPIHSSLKPEYIAAAQQLHVDRNEPLPTPQMPGAGDSGGRPAAKNTLATPAQRITDRG